MAHTREEASADAGINRLGRVVLAMDTRLEIFTLKTGITIQDMRIQTPAQTGGGYKVILRGWYEDGTRLITFGEGDDFSSCMVMIEAKLAAVAFKWFVDVPYAERQAGAKATPFKLEEAAGRG